MSKQKFHEERLESSQRESESLKDKIINHQLIQSELVEFKKDFEALVSSVPSCLDDNEQLIFSSCKQLHS